MALREDALAVKDVLYWGVGVNSQKNRGTGAWHSDLPPNFRGLNEK